MSEEQRPHMVIVIDDDATIRLLIQKTLERKGYSVQAASNGEEGLSYLRAHRDVKLALIDQFMPGLYGDQVAREIRSFAPEIKLVLCSGYPAEKLPTEHFDSVLAKPFRPKALVEHISSMLDVA